MTKVDFISANRGSIVVLTAVTQGALDWIDANLDEEAAPHVATINVEPRYFLDLACAILSDGLTLQDVDSGRMASLPH